MGESACWLERVCVTCGRPDEDLDEDGRCASCAPPRLLTVGHGPDEPESLIARWRSAHVASVVDVRRFPGSRRHPRLAGEAMQQWLPDAGIAYRWEPRLGGRRRPVPGSAHVGLRDEGFRAYADHMQTAEFTAALAVLLAEVRRRPTAILCAESVWWRCHRRLIADAVTLLHEMPVGHVMPDGRLMPHRLTDAVRLNGPALLYDHDPGDGTARHDA